MITKPELLLPAGSPDAFIAALEGGADAIYLGLADFNARGRAKNFSIDQLPALQKKASQYHARIYITLNTLIKNSELPRLIEYLIYLNQFPPSAVIIQDWGVFHLIKTHFPKLTVHASTQMGNHNSADCLYAGSRGFARVILARELKLDELIAITAKTKTELEIFAHGALCYSLSGSCLFSSYYGGMSANRGQCRQPCRHLFQNGKCSERFFSMKDFELIDYLPQITRLGIKAIKIEGRMRSADYVYTVAKAYRMAIDQPERIPEAKGLLSFDGGREKTTWFFSGKSSFSTTGNSFTGKGIGIVKEILDDRIVLSLTEPIADGDSIRIQNDTDTDSHVWQVSVIETFSTSDPSFLHCSIRKEWRKDGETMEKVCVGNLVYKLNRQSDITRNFKPAHSNLTKPDTSRIRKILYTLSTPEALNRKPLQPQLYVRITDAKWIRYLADMPLKAVLYPISLDVDYKTKLRLIPELPYFVPEDEIINLTNRTKTLIKNGCHSFVLSRLSQISLFKDPHKLTLLTNEQVYTLNDAAVLHLKSQGIGQYILPLENDFPNLLAGKYRDGIIPLFFHPALYHSRQRIPAKHGDKLLHNKDELLYLNDGEMVQVFPKQAVCNFSFYPRLMEKGYGKYLIDLSLVKPDKAFLDTLLEYLYQGKNLPETIRFNMKKGLW